MLGYKGKEIWGKNQLRNSNQKETNKTFKPSSTLIQFIFLYEIDSFQLL